MKRAAGRGDRFAAASIDWREGYTLLAQPLSITEVIFDVHSRVASFLTPSSLVSPMQRCAAADGLARRRTHTRFSEEGQR